MGRVTVTYHPHRQAAGGGDPRPREGGLGHPDGPTVVPQPCPAAPRPAGQDDSWRGRGHPYRGRQQVEDHHPERRQAAGCGGQARTGGPAMAVRPTPRSVLAEVPGAGQPAFARRARRATASLRTLGGSAADSGTRYVVSDPAGCSRACIRRPILQPYGNRQGRPRRRHPGRVSGA